MSIISLLVHPRHRWGSALPRKHLCADGVPMAAPVKTIINVVVILLVVVWLLEAFGVVGPWHLGGRLR